jgi:hypothetical protein
MLRNVINFIPSIELFGDGLAMIATRTEIADGHTEEEYIDTEIIPWLNQARNSLHIDFEEEKLRRAYFVVDTILMSKRIAIFRMPDECGPLSDIESMQANKNKLHDLTYNVLKFVKPSVSAFNVSLSTETLLTVLKVGNKLFTDVQDLLDLFSETLNKFMMAEFDCTSPEPLECESLISKLEVLFGNPDFSNAYSNESVWKSLDFKPGMERLTNRNYIPPGLAIPDNVTDLLQKYTSYLDYLDDLESLQKDILPWVKPFISLHSDVINNTLRASEKFSSKVISNLVALTVNFDQYMTREFDCVDPSGACPDLVSSLDVLFSNPDFVDGYNNETMWKGLSFFEVIKRLTNRTFFSFEIHDSN